MNQVEQRMNCTAGMQIIDVSQIVEPSLEELKLEMNAKDTIIKALVETIENVRDQVQRRNQYQFWKKEMIQMQNALNIAKGKLP
jgi:uncharacterized membrane protein